MPIPEDRNRLIQSPPCEIIGAETVCVGGEESQPPACERRIPQPNRFTTRLVLVADADDQCGDKGVEQVALDRLAVGKTIRIGSRSRWRRQVEPSSPSTGWTTRLPGARSERRSGGGTPVASAAAAVPVEWIGVET
jgi:hypothetical protein